jgi:anti-anti-sigma factor
LIVSGEIDLATIGEFDRAVREATNHHQRVIIDLTGVEFLANVGLRTLYRYRENLIAVLITPGSLVARALHITGFPGIVTVPTNHEQAPAG